jgi:hypothetical protein
MRKIFFILITVFLFSSCTKYNSEIVYRVERPDGVIRDTINFVTFNSNCMVKYDNEKFVLILDDKVNRGSILVSKYPIVVESFQKVKIN